jgi:hypothetical protein
MQNLLANWKGVIRNQTHLRNSTDYFEPGDQERVIDISHAMVLARAKSVWDLLAEELNKFPTDAVVVKAIMHTQHSSHGDQFLVRYYVCDV